MGRRGTVTDLTRQAAVVSGQAQRIDVTMARTALLASGKADGVRDYRVDRSRSVVAEIAEGVGNQDLPSHNEADAGQGEHDEQAGDLLRDVLRAKRKSHERRAS
jgi:hypothetical protein